MSLGNPRRSPNVAGDQCCVELRAIYHARPSSGLGHCNRDPGPIAGVRSGQPSLGISRGGSRHAQDRTANFRDSYESQDCTWDKSLCDVRAQK